VVLDQRGVAEEAVWDTCIGKWYTDSGFHRISLTEIVEVAIPGVGRRVVIH
jgi:hypothetical protein